jgi:hypothetical protein
MEEKRDAAPVTTANMTNKSWKPTPPKNQRKNQSQPLSRNVQLIHTDIKQEDILSGAESHASSAEANTTNEQSQRGVTPDHKSLLADRVYASGIKRTLLQAQLFPSKESTVEGSVTLLSQPLVTPSSLMEKSLVPRRPNLNKNLTSPTKVSVASTVGHGSSLPTSTIPSLSFVAAEDKDKESTRMSDRCTTLSARDAYYVQMHHDHHHHDPHDHDHAHSPIRPQRPLNKYFRKISENHDNGDDHDHAGHSTDGTHGHPYHDPRRNVRVKEGRRPNRSEVLTRSAQLKTFTESVEESICSAGVPKDSFRYLVRASENNPYQLVVVDPKVIQQQHRQQQHQPQQQETYRHDVTNSIINNVSNLSDYYTMSRAGLTHFCHGTSEFTTLETFEREHYMFSLLREIPFFKQYRVCKQFRTWAQSVRQSKIHVCKRVLSSDLFLLRPRSVSSVVSSYILIYIERKLYIYCDLYIYIYIDRSVGLFLERFSLVPQSLLPLSLLACQ